MKILRFSIFDFQFSIFDSLLSSGCFLLAFLGALAAHAQQPPPQPSEYEVKAAFLYNFAKFVEWPSQAFSDAGSPFTIGVVGDNPFGDDLERTLRDKALNGHPIAAKQVKAPSELRTCHILFISPSEKKRLPDILKLIRDAGVLTVSEMEDFLPAGGMINFLMVDNKVRFEINDEPAKRAGLRLSSKLLHLGKRSERAGAK